MQRGAVSTAHGTHVMFDSFRKFLSDVSEGEKRPTHFEHDDYRLAAAALLVHAAAIDGSVSDVERERLHAVIKRQFGLDEETTDELVAEATAAEHDAIDLYHFTTLINRSLEEDGRRRVVEMMWEMVYADGHVSEFERQPDLARRRPARRFIARPDRARASRWRAGGGPASAATSSLANFKSNIASGRHLLEGCREVCELRIIQGTSAAGLKFLSLQPQARSEFSNPKTAPGS